MRIARPRGTPPGSAVGGLSRAVWPSVGNDAEHVCEHGRTVRLPQRVTRAPPCQVHVNWLIPRPPVPAERASACESQDPGPTRPARALIRAIAPVRFRIHEDRIAQVRAGEIRAGDVGAAEVRVWQARTDEDREAEVRTANIRADERRVVEYRIPRLASERFANLRFASPKSMTPRFASLRFAPTRSMIRISFSGLRRPMTVSAACTSGGVVRPGASLLASRDGHCSRMNADSTSVTVGWSIAESRAMRSRA